MVDPVKREEKAMTTTNALDVTGIGIGPSNLSVAALLATTPRVRARFFERRHAFQWHPGMMLPGSRMQTSFLKDLVTPVSPTSPFSFIAYLVATGRFYRFINADFTRVRRAEFVAYLRWVADQVPSLSFGQGVEEVTFDGREFVTRLSNGETVRSRDVSVGVGNPPNIPAWARAHVGSTCFHNETYLGSDLSVDQRRVVVVGGGQSGAELFLDVLSGARGLPREVVWITRRPNVEPLDETSFTNEHFTPDYVRQFRRLSPERRKALVDSQKLYTDGVSPETVREVSQRLYECDFLSPDANRYRLLSYREVKGMRREGGAFNLEMFNGFNQKTESVETDVVLLATGYRFGLPPFLEPIADKLARDDDGNMILEEDYSVVWDGPPSSRIFMMNAGRVSHGIADSALSLAAWRSAMIVNSILGAQVYPTEPCQAPVEWASSSQGEAWVKAAAESILA